MAPGTPSIEYVTGVPTQKLVVPAIEPGVAGVVSIVSASAEASLAPQALEAVTLMLPPLVLAVALIEFVDDVPVHPSGNVQV